MVKARAADSRGGGSAVTGRGWVRAWGQSWGSWLLFLLGLILLGGVDLASARGEGPVRIGVSLALSGKYAPMGESQAHGFRLWEQQINEQGGLLGRPVELIISDDRSRPELAREIYRRLISDEKVDLLFAPFSSEISMAVLPLTEEHRYPLLASGAASDELWQGHPRYLFGIFTPAGKFTFSLLEMLVAYAIDNLAIFYCQDPLSRSAVAGTVKLAGWLGLNIMVLDDFDRDQADYPALVERARLAGAKAVIMAGHLEEAVAMRQAMADLEWFPQIYYATQGPGLDAFVQRLGDAADGVFGTEQWHYLGGVDPDKSGARFVQAYQEKYGRSPHYFAFTAYAAGTILAAATEEAGSLERVRIRDILANLDTQTIIGRYRVDPHGRQARSFTLVTQRQNGRLEVVWPRSLMTAEPLL